MSLEEKIIDKLTVKSLGFHLHNYANLFLKPVDVWLKILNIQKTSYNLFILHLIYYSLLLLFIVKDYKLAIPLTFLEILITTIPWLIFILPFKFFTTKLKIRLNAVRLFRILMIIKLQCIPITLLFILSAYYFKFDILFTFFENFNYLVWILFIAVIPSLTKIKLAFKIIWIVVNYIFVSCFLVIIGFLFAEFPDEFSSLENKIRITTPNTEYSKYKEECTNGRYYIDDSYLLVLAFNNKGSKKHSSIKLQLTSNEMVSAFLKKNVNNSLDLMKRNKLFTEYVKNRKYYPKDEELTIEKLAILENKIDQLFYKDLDLIKQYNDSSIFPSNKKYFHTLLTYYLTYEKSVFDMKEVTRIIKTQNLYGKIIFNDTASACLFSIKNNPYLEVKLDIEHQKEKLENRLNQSTFFAEILFYPLFAYIGYKIENE